MGDLLRKLSLHTGLQEREVRRIMLVAPERYKRYTIPKRDGTPRQIAQPTQEVKAIQRALVDVLLVHLPIHPSATAYRSGKSLRDNAAPHAHNGPILKMDLKNFFPSIRVQDWHTYALRTSILDEEDTVLSGQLLFHRIPATRVLRLAIGAPSSPTLSNILMYDFDSAVTSSVERDHVVYTRYADDLTFSAQRTGFLTGVQSAVAGVVRSTRSPKLEINKDKTTYATKKYHRVVTGLTLSNDGRVTIGRDRKRTISSAMHHATLGELSAAEIDHLSGMLAFVNSVEPAFLEVLRAKYGDDAVDRVVHHTPSRKGPPQRWPR